MAATAKFQLQFAGYGQAHPAATALLFDAALHNDRDTPRWFVLPSSVDPSDPGGFSANAIEVLRLESAGALFVCHFIGAGGFRAIRVPAHAGVRIRHLPVNWMVEPPLGRAIIRCAIADDIVVGNQHASAWIPIDVTCEPSAEGDFDTWSVASAVETPDAKEAPVRLLQASVEDVAIDIIRR